MKHLILCLGMLSMFGACANDGMAAPGNSRRPDAAAPRHAKEEADSPMTKEDAVRLAQTHLALKKTGWGEPNSVEEQGGKFYLTYETPEREMRLIGQRTLIVDQQTGVVSFQKRR